ncbi:MAG: hypothetical protein AUJ51_01920 [Elusimicrobia bacterium CG1_02_56_21]|nr:MAG: hypothetical protein AUJ51_01920 [Elusimicrobia bacterium CG1_02_56_21]
MKKHKKLKIILVPASSYSDEVPLASGLLKAYAEQDSFLRPRVDIKIFDHGGDFGRVARELPAMKPDLAGFTVYGNLKTTLAAAARIKKSCGAKIIFGGTFLPAVEKENIFAGGAVDFAAMGEGELTFSELLKALLGRGSLSDVKGLVFRSGGDISVNPPRPLNPDINGLPSPYLKGVFTGNTYGTAHIEASRGCINACSYCSLPGTYRTFDADRFEAELKTILRDFPDIRCVYPTDSDFLHNKQSVKLLKLLSKELDGKGIAVELQINLMNMSDAHIRPLNDQNFNVRAGIQSTHADTCMLVNRKMDLETANARLRSLAADAPDSKIGLSFIMGLPGDTLEKYLGNLDWGLSVNSALSFFRLRVFPRSPLGRRAAELGVEYHKEEPFFVTATPSMGKKDMARADAATKELALPASVVSADKYFGFLFRRLCAADGGRLPRVELCRKLNKVIRRDKRFSGLIKAAGAGHEDNDWEMVSLETLQPYRLALIRELAKTASGQVSKKFAGRFADFTAARLEWNALDGGRAADLITELCGESEARRLVVCSANSYDFSKWRLPGTASHIRIEEKLDQLRFRDMPKGLPRLDRSRLGFEFPKALAGMSKGFRQIFILQAFSAAAPSIRVALLKSLRSRAARNADIFLVYNSLGYPAFGPGWELTGGWHDYSEKRLKADLSAAGWKNPVSEGQQNLRVTRARN